MATSRARRESTGRVGQQVTARADDVVGGDAEAAADPAAGAGGRQALLGADDDEFADELGKGSKDVEDEPAAGARCVAGRSSRVSIRHRQPGR